MEPMMITSKPEVRPAGNMVIRGLTAVIAQQKMPYQVATWGDRLLKTMGSKHRVIRASGLDFLVRRGTWADESIIRHVVVEREYHPPGYEIGPDDTVIDIGGNIGAFAVTACRSTNGRVITCEPEPGNAALLRRNLDRNGCRNVTVVNAAVSGRSGALTLHLNPDNSGGHSAHRSLGGPTVTVPAITLQDLFDEHRIARCDFLKMDCEGAEYDILYSFPQEYYSRTRRIVLEYHGEPTTKREQAGGLVRHLTKIGYRIDHYTDIVGSRGGLIFATRNTDSPDVCGRA